MGGNIDIVCLTYTQEKPIEATPEGRLEIDTYLLPHYNPYCYSNRLSCYFKNPMVYTLLVLTLDPQPLRGENDRYSTLYVGGENSILYPLNYPPPTPSHFRWRGEEY